MISTLPNQNPEQKARDNIDRQLIACGWIIQDKKKINLSAGIGVAIKESHTDVGPADYILFAEKNMVQKFQVLQTASAIPDQLAQFLETGFNDRFFLKPKSRLIKVYANTFS